MKYFCLIMTLFTMNAWAQLPLPDVLAHFRLNDTTNPVVTPEAPTKLDIWFSDQNTGTNIKDLIKTEGKMMHLVLVKNDLSVIKYFYPKYDKATGQFSITLNATDEDPDNYQTARALVNPGQYQIIADIESASVGKRTAFITIEVTGEATHKPLVLDPVDADFSITKRMMFGDNEYQARMSHGIIVGCFGFIVDFELEVKVKNAEGVFEPLNDIVEMFEFGGHGVWVSEFVYQGGLVNYLRVAAPMPLEPGKLLFRFNDRNILNEGNQRIWFRFKHGDKFINFPYTFEYYPPIDGSNDDCIYKQSKQISSLHF